ncbi:hypothetical protein H5T53_02020 [Candidatus Bipolaricaulota bacterium]|nr:hypothetical protein [Candidatus Bipolaricaulota bacterium]
MSRCCGLSGVGFIEVGGRRVGILGLRRALEEVAKLGLADPETIGEELLARVSRENFVPPAQRLAYREALLRAYRKAVGDG